MDPSALGARLASSVVAPLVRKLFVQEGPGAGLVDAPVRISALVSFRGERRTLSEQDLHKLAAELVRRAVRAAAPGERPVSEDEEPAVAAALATTLAALGTLAMADIQAVHLGPAALADQLRAAAPQSTRELSRDAELLHHTLLTTACLHVIHFFTQRSTFVARTLVQQSRTLDTLVTKIDTFLADHPSPRAADLAFEHTYLAHLARKHGRLTIYGIDLHNSPDRWPLDAAYMSLQAAGPGRAEDPFEDLPPRAPVPADQALAGRDHVLLRGVAGSGKSTLVQWLAVSCTKPLGTTALPHLYGRIPFVLPLRTLTRAGAALPTPDRFLAATGCPVSGTQPTGWADRVLTAGRALLLVDGLDEIPEREREATRRWLRDLLDAFPGNLWLATTRPSAVRDDWLAPEGFDELTLSPMSRDEVAAFIARWHRAARHDADDPDRLDAYEQSLLTAVRTKPDLGRLATNPLMCGLICALHRDRRGYLPHGRKELYDAALSMLLSRRDRERDMRGPDGIELADEPQIQLLQRLAYWLIRNGRTELDRDRAERILADILPAVPAAASQGPAPAVFRHLLHRSGLLREPAPGTVDFIHRTFQDYLGAKAAVEEGDFGLLVQHAGESQWEDVIRMAVAHARPRERAEFLRELVAKGDGIKEPGVRLRVHVLAMACLEHATELDPGVREEVNVRVREVLPPRTRGESTLLAQVGPIVLELLPGPDGLENDEAQEVVATAAAIGSDAALECIKRFRSHPDFNVRNRLGTHWSAFEASRYAEEIIQHIGTDVIVTVNSTAELRALKALGGRPRTTMNGSFTARELRDGLHPAQLTHLALTNNPEISDLAFLKDFPALKSLTLQDCPAVESLAPLRDLRLDSLGISGDVNVVRTPRGLDGLTHLHSLSLLAPLPPEGLDAFPLHAPLQLLTLGQRIRPDFARLASWPLRSLQLQRLTNESAEEKWRTLAGLPGLKFFSFGLAEGEAALRIAPGQELPQVETLSLVNTGRRPATEFGALLRTALPAFPSIRKLQLYGLIGGQIDLSPVETLPALQSLFLSNLAPSPDHPLPPHLNTTLFPRPRA
ncbi:MULTISPECIES: NACHT domain-containing protein [unclassified Streptomyces]|uniref:NACHT domain-containing protein n=1 Tax=unclassified Streptomyces TaxID=2593676 RepID=UPI0003778833|nr:MULTISPECIES: NACHT domain-containing protein [unclassified Streptomyces]MYT33502.1 NACHT domain-containing protein [Streptomyces sp. SID8354]